MHSRDAPSFDRILKASSESSQIGTLDTHSWQSRGNQKHILACVCISLHSVYATGKLMAVSCSELLVLSLITVPPQKTMGPPPQILRQTEVFVQVTPTSLLLLWNRIICFRILRMSISENTNWFMSERLLTYCSTTKQIYVQYLIIVVWS